MVEGTAPEQRMIDGVLCPFVMLAPPPPPAPAPPPHAYVWSFSMHVSYTGVAAAVPVVRQTKARLVASRYHTHRRAVAAVMPRVRQATAKGKAASPADVQTWVTDNQAFIQARAPPLETCALATATPPTSCSRWALALMIIRTRCVKFTIL